jgi:thiamine-phosphate pyrophosphorylase
MHRSIATLQYLTMDLPSFPHVKQVQMACEAGLSWIQLRMKLPPYEEQLQIAVDARKITDDYGCILIVNDHVTIARDAGADGVHLGRDDMHWEEARTVLGKDAIIGVSTHSWAELTSYREAVVQYGGLGPYRFTSTKEKLDAVLGLEGIKEVIAQKRMNDFELPLIAIGGIELKDVQSLLNVGVSGIAVSSAISRSSNPMVTAQAFLQQVKIFKEEKEIIQP